MSIGIENLKQLHKAAGIVSSAFVGIIGDKHLGIEDVPGVIKILMAIPGLASIEYAQLQSEIKDLDEVEKKELEQVFKDNFTLPNPVTEQLIESGVSVVLSILKLVC